MNTMAGGAAQRLVAQIGEMDLPELPQKDVVDTHLPTGVRIYGYTAKQMREYARASIAARQPVEESVEEDVYCAIGDMIEPYVLRDGINPDGALPASVHDSVSILLEHWLKTRQPVEQEPVGYARPEDLVSDGFGHTFTVYQSSVPLKATAPVYAAPPAQAVDLGQFREAVRYASITCPHEDLAAKLTELLALIDSSKSNHNYSFVEKDGQLWVQKGTNEVMIWIANLEKKA